MDFILPLMLLMLIIAVCHSLTRLDGEANEHFMGNNRNESDDGEDQDPEYPLDEIRSVFEAHPHFEVYFVTKGSRLPSLRPDYDGEPVCATTINHYYAPKSLNNTRQEQRTIVNDKHHRQYVQKGICRNSSPGHCGSNGVCVQQYSIVKLMVYDKDDVKKIVPDWFNIESCCVCSVK